ncbi:hypothetical protein BF49_4696 [Bradyrhizobium sp.]|nr:hypothetical protein BF49_4696 [Bradyrhizobium sp.]
MASADEMAAKLNKHSENNEYFGKVTPMPVDFDCMLERHPRPGGQ